MFLCDKKYTKIPIPFVKRCQFGIIYLFPHPWFFVLCFRILNSLLACSQNYSIVNKGDFVCGLFVPSVCARWASTITDCSIV